MSLTKTPIDQYRNDVSSYISTNPFKPNQFNYQSPKIDHAFIRQSYRKLRIQQRQQLAHLRMPDQLKRKIFNFKQDDDLRYQKPQLVIFNHPFRGKMVMTRKQVQKQLERQRKNAQTVQEKQLKGQKIGQNIFNDLGLKDQTIIVQRAQVPGTLQNQNQRQKQQLYKPQFLHKMKTQQLAQQINRKQQQKRQQNIFFINKPKQKEQTQKQRTQKVKRLEDQKRKQFDAANSKLSKEKKKVRLMDENDGRMQQRSKQKRKNVQNKLKDMPIIGQQPKVVRDVKYYQQNNSNQKLHKKGGMNSYSKPITQHPPNQSFNQKKYFHPFGQQTQIRQFKKKPTNNNKDILAAIPSIQSIQQRNDSGKLLYTKNQDSHNNNDQLNRSFVYNHNQNKESISAISEIQQNRNQEKQESESNQSLNRALFIKQGNYNDVKKTKK